MNINENPTTSESQNNMILAYMMDGKRITSLEALKLFGCMRLASRISDLRRYHPDVDIRSEFITLANNKRVAQYYINQ